MKCEIRNNILQRKIIDTMNKRLLFVIFVSNQLLLCVGMQKCKIDTQTIYCCLSVVTKYKKKYCLVVCGREISIVN